MMESKQMFSAWIAEQARGTVDDRATLELADVVRAVSALGKKGSLVIEGICPDVVAPR